MIEIDTMLMQQARAGKEIAGNYDLTLLTDLDDEPLNPTRSMQVFAVGEQEDRKAGIFGGAVSPWFKTEDQAWAWCYTNEEFLEGQYGDVES